MIFAHLPILLMFLDFQGTWSIPFEFYLEKSGVEFAYTIKQDTTPVSVFYLTENCDNEIDDDNDGLIDSFDPDCSCDDQKYNAVCKPECELLPDSFPQISAKLKWVSELGISNNSIPSSYQYFSSLYISDSNIYANGVEKYLDSFSNFIQILNPKNGKNKNRIDLGNYWSPVPVTAAIIRNNSLLDNILTYNVKEELTFLNQEQTLWTNNLIPDYFRKLFPYFVDLNSDGIAEIIFGNYVINSETGGLLLHTGGSAGCNATSNFNPCSGAHSVAGDFTNHPGLEIACGNKLYQPVFSNLNDSIGNTFTIITAPEPVMDGHTVMADINGDGKLDIIVIKDNFNNDGGLWAWDPREIKIIASLHPSEDIPKRGGVPVIANILGNCLPEIIIAYSNEIRIFSYDGLQYFTLVYSIPTTDNSGLNRVAVFDLNGDGMQEIIYRDETSLRIFDGPSGIKLFEYPLLHLTAREIPIITDVDDDGHAEIIIDGTMPGDTVTRIYCFESEGVPWMPARKIWNQRSYHVTNVNDDMTIPSMPQNTAAFFDTDSCLMQTCPQVYNTFNVQATYRTQKGCVPYPAKDISALTPYYECTSDSVIIYLPTSIRSPLDVDSIPISIWIAAPQPMPTPLLQKNVFLEGEGLRQKKIDTFRIALPMIDPDINRVTIRLNAPSGVGIDAPLDGLTTFKECEYENNTISLDIDIATKELNIGQDTSICQGQTLTLTANDGFSSYLWNDQSSDALLTITEAGSWSILTTDQCKRIYLDTISVTEIQFDEPSLISMTICQGDSLPIVLTDVYDQIMWNPERIVSCTTCSSILVYPEDTTTLYLSATKYNCTFEDSILISVKPQIIDYISHTLCLGDTLNFNNTEYTQPGLYTIPLNACDSLVFLDITVRNPQVMTFSETICEGDSVQILGMWYNESVMIDHQYTDQYGCDSIYTIQVVKTESFRDTVQSFICFGERIVIQNLDIERDTVLQYDIEAIVGCDTLRTHIVEVKPVAESFDSLTICQGSAIIYKGETITSPGDYTIRIQQPGQCDSIFYLSLSETDEIQTFEKIEICQGDSVFLNNQWIFDNLTFENTYVSSSGCDSISMVTVSLLPLLERSMEVSICQGDSIRLYDTWFSELGSYQILTQNPMGCDSLVGVYINIQTRPTTSEEIRLCPGDSILIGDKWVNESGKYETIIPTVTSCDSMHTTWVTMIQPPQAPEVSVDCEAQNVVVSIGAFSEWKLVWDNGDTSSVTRYNQGDSATVQFYAEPDCHGIFTIQLPKIPHVETLTFPTDTTTTTKSNIFLSVDVDTSIWKVLWSPSFAVDCNNCPQVNISLETSTEMTLTLQHISGCIYEHRFRIDIGDAAPMWSIPNIFLPAVQTENSRWRVLVPEGVSMLSCQVYDRWSDKVYEVTRGESIDWDGSFRGQEVISGVYVYIIEWLDSTGKIHLLKGDVTVLR